MPSLLLPLPASLLRPFVMPRLAVPVSPLLLSLLTALVPPLVLPLLVALVPPSVLPPLVALVPAWEPACASLQGLACEPYMCLHRGRDAEAKRGQQPPKGSTCASGFPHCTSPVDLTPIAWVVVSPRVYIMPSLVHGFPVGRAGHVQCHHVAVHGFSFEATRRNMGKTR